MILNSFDYDCYLETWFSQGLKAWFSDHSSDQSLYYCVVPVLRPSHLDLSLPWLIPRLEQAHKRLMELASSELFKRLFHEQQWYLVFGFDSASPSLSIDLWGPYFMSQDRSYVFIDGKSNRLDPWVCRHWVRAMPNFNLHSNLQGQICHETLYVAATYFLPSQSFCVYFRLYEACLSVSQCCYFWWFTE